MNLFRRDSVIMVLLITLTAVTPACSSSRRPRPSARQAVDKPAPSEWSQPNGDLANTRVANNSAINSGNVQQLRTTWSVAIDGVSAFGALATNPIVVDHTVYFEDLKSNV